MLDQIVDHGMHYLWNTHRDADKGGYFWAVDDNGAADNGRKQAYGHAFALLAASSASLVGHPLADTMIADVTERLATLGVRPTGWLGPWISESDATPDLLAELLRK